MEVILLSLFYKENNWGMSAGDQPQLIQGIRRRDGLGDYLYAN